MAFTKRRAQIPMAVHSMHRPPPLPVASTTASTLREIHDAPRKRSMSHYLPHSSAAGWASTAPATASNRAAATFMFFIAYAILFNQLRL